MSKEIDNMDLIDKTSAVTINKKKESKKVNILRNEYLPTDEEIEDLSFYKEQYLLHQFDISTKPPKIPNYFCAIKRQNKV